MNLRDPQNATERAIHTPLVRRPVVAPLATPMLELQGHLVRIRPLLVPRGVRPVPQVHLRNGTKTVVSEMRSRGRKGRKHEPRKRPVPRSFCTTSHIPARTLLSPAFCLLYTPASRPPEQSPGRAPRPSPWAFYCRHCCYCSRCYLRCSAS